MELNGLDLGVIITLISTSAFLGHRMGQLEQKVKDSCKDMGDLKADFKAHLRECRENNKHREA